MSEKPVGIHDSGLPLPEQETVVWRECMRNNIVAFVEYVPSPDGVFERWMDENDPLWNSESTHMIEFLRNVWAAGVAHGRTSDNETQR